MCCEGRHARCGIPATPPSHSLPHQLSPVVSIWKPPLLSCVTRAKKLGVILVLPPSHPFPIHHQSLLILSQSHRKSTSLSVVPRPPAWSRPCHGASRRPHALSPSTLSLCAILHEAPSAVLRKRQSDLVTSLLKMFQRPQPHLGHSLTSLI